MAIRRVNPLRSNVPIADKNGNPTPMFQRLWQSLFLNDNQIATLDQLIASISTWEIVAGTGLSGGGPLVNSPVTIDLEDTAVTPGTYGDATNVAQITVDQQGRITDVQEVAISGSGGTERWFNGIASASAAAVNTSARATKGVRVTPSFDMTIDALWAQIDQAVNTDNYQGIIASLSGSGATATVVSVLATTPNVSAGHTSEQISRFVFSSPVSLTAGTTYLVGVIFNQASGTAVARVGGSAGNDQVMVAPTTHHGRFFYNTVGLSAGQAPNVAEDVGSFFIYLEGTYTP